MAEFSDYAWLVSDAAAPWLDRAARDERSELQALAALRRDLPAERARLVVEQAALRERAAAKFGAAAERMFFTRPLLEQATDRWLAQYKATRLAEGSGGAPMVDYCCGIGGDLLAMAAAAPATGWDRSEVACLLAEANLAAAAVGGRAASAVRCGDVATLTPAAGERWHLDPDRRASGRRTTQVEMYEPPPAVIDRWLAANDDGAVKLAPGADAPEAWAERAELEWISTGGECRQLVAWFGRTARTPGRRRATVLSTREVGAVDAAPVTFVGQSDQPLASTLEPLDYLYDPDPSILAAGLLGALASDRQLVSLGAGGAYLTGAAVHDDALADRFVVRDYLPLRVAEVARYLAARGVGRVEIKKRGVSLDPEKFRRELKLHGDGAATVVLTRLGRRATAIICDRAERSEG